MRIPFAPDTSFTFAPGPFWKRGELDARWLQGETGVGLYRCRFVWPGGPLRLHVSADQRYELFLDGARIGRGPDRGDDGHWRFATHEEALAAGEHVLVARVWWWDNAPCAQITIRPGFLCVAEGAAAALLSTGLAPWEWRADAAFAPLPNGVCWGTGAKNAVTVDADYLASALGGGSMWQPAKPGDAATIAAAGPLHRGRRHFLTPTTLPAQEEVVIRAGTVRRTTGPAVAWQAVLDGTGNLTVPPHSEVRAVIDLGVYRCAYPEVTAAGHGTLRIAWAEALFTDTDGNGKVHRAAVDDLNFVGVADAFTYTGVAGTATTLWWQAGRFVELVITTGDQPFDLRDLRWRETGYPLRNEADFRSSDARLDACLPLLERVLRMCAHETYMDCPYYEQLQYIGDTRLECLVTRALTRDHRLPDYAVHSFAWSLGEDGLLASRWPSAEWQSIPTFSLLWIGMLHDLLWYGDPAQVRPLLGAMRSIVERFRAQVRDDGLLGWVPGWNFVDWVPSWPDGEVPGQQGHTSTVTTWLFAYALGLAAAIEDWAGEPALAQRHRTLATRLAAGCESCWDETRGAYRDGPTQTTFSEHAQVLALLSGEVTPARRDRLLTTLEHDPDLARTTVYFSHYLFEVAARFARPELLLRRLEYWKALPDQGFTTVPERPEPSRSDCHAWGAHPWYHLLASVLGIRPAAPGYRAVRITPHLGSLTRAAGVWPHPLGDIRVSIDGAHGAVELPAGLPGTLVLAGREIVIDGAYRW
jgi:hypothetical protein